MKNLIATIILFFFFSHIIWAENNENSSKAKGIKIENAIQTAAGTIDRYLFHSEFVDERYIDIWLPEGYSIQKEYAVLYMQDGQMLYDAGNSWNKHEWDVDTTLTSLLKAKKIKDVIVIGIHNNGNKRHIEYFPQKAIDYITEPEREELMKLFSGKPLADNYLKFIVQELKKFVDENYSTKRDQENTFICGSSMGGLISIYALCEYPEIFTGAACLSTHWIGTFDYNKQIPAGINKYLKLHLPSAYNHKIYFDHGTKGLDANYAEFQKQVDQIAKETGYNKKTFLSLEFPEEDHSEVYWAKRLSIPLLFLLKK